MIGQQAWSDGKIGMAGGSYLGWVQWQSAPHRSQYLTCIAPRVMCGDLYSGPHSPRRGVPTQRRPHVGDADQWSHRGRALSTTTGRRPFARSPLIDMDQQAGRTLQFWRDWVTHSEYDSYWDSVNVENKWGEIAAPALIMGGWYDLYSHNTFINFNGLRLHGRTARSEAKSAHRRALAARAQRFYQDRRHRLWCELAVRLGGFGVALV